MENTLYHDFIPTEPETKRVASLNDPFGAQLAAMKQSTGGFSFPVGLGITGSGKACMEEVRIPDGLVGLSKLENCEFNFVSPICVQDTLEFVCLLH